jgi:hypothetical protein
MSEKNQKFKNKLFVYLKWTETLETTYFEMNFEMQKIDEYIEKAMNQ